MKPKKVAILTAGGLAPCLNSAVGGLIERYTEIDPSIEIICYRSGYKGLLLGDFIEVTDVKSFDMTRRLARSEGILTGGSGGLAVHAALEVAAEDTDRLVVVIVPDSGRGYLSKVFNDEWMEEHGFTQ